MINLLVDDIFSVWGNGCTVLSGGDDLTFLNLIINRREKVIFYSSIICTSAWVVFGAKAPGVKY